MELKTQINTNPIRKDNITIPHFNRVSIKQNKQKSKLSDIIHQIDLKYIHRLVHQNTTDNKQFIIEQLMCQSRNEIKLIKWNENGNKAQQNLLYFTIFYQKFKMWHGNTHDFSTLK